MGENNIKEIWKPITDFENSYQVSNLGNVKSIDRFFFCKSKNTPKLFKGKILKQRLDHNGYSVVNLKKNQKSHLKKVHRLVADAFIAKIENKEYINHKDGNKLNNIVSNLEWCTCKENAYHREKNLLIKPKLTKEQILDIKHNCVKSKNQFDAGNNSISYFAKKYNVCRSTITDILKGKQIYLGALLCK